MKTRVLVAIVVLLAGGCSRVSSAPDAADLKAPRTLAADPVSAAPPVRRLPPGCGVAAGTVERLVPKADTGNAGDFGLCRWYGPDGMSLSVTLTPFVGRNGMVSAQPATVTRPPLGRPGRSGLIPTTPQAAAVAALTQGISRNGQRYAITGLGDGAVAQALAEGGVHYTINLRVSDVVATIEYSRAVKPRGSLRLRTAGFQLASGALRAAREVVTNLGGTVGTTKIVSVDAGGTGAAPPADVCALIPASVLGEVIEAPEATPEKGQDATTGTATAGCVWESGKHVLKAAVKSLPDAWAAEREYLRLYLNARAEQPLGKGGARYFSPLAGLGEQAFGAYVTDGAPGRVIFRRGNLLAEAVYISEDPAEPLSPKQTINGAAAVAAELAAHLPK